MFVALFKKVIGSRNDRLLRQYDHTVRAVNALEGSVASLSDAELRAKTEAFKSRCVNGETLDALQDQSDKLPDMADRASSETDRSIELRARDRQRKLIAKIDSKCKIGRYIDDKDKFYDFMIRIDQNSDLEFYLNQVYHYTKLF